MPHSSYKCENHPDRQARSSKTLLCSYCYKKQLLNKNPEFKERQKEAQRTFHKNNPIYRSEYYWKEKESNPEKIAKATCSRVEYNLKRKLSSYGLTLEQYDKMLLNGCVICSSKERPHLDHCHTTGKFRGLLCGNCNTGLGMFKDDIEKLQRVISYLESFKCWQS